METLSLCLRGGLGNNLFQIASVNSICLRDSFRFVINPNDSYGGHRKIDDYKNNFFRKLNFEFISEITHRHNQCFFDFREVPKFSSSHHIEGYFQSEKYFVDYRNQTLELFSPSKEILEKLRTHFPYVFTENCCSIHVRRGDYTHSPDKHPTMSVEYYKNSIDFFDSNTKFIIFSDDLEWCVNNFGFIENKIFVDSLEDFEQLYLMSFCQNNIIANSTFSWWGAWLNEYKEKKIIAPNIWFGPGYSSYDTKDVIPDNWIKI